MTPSEEERSFGVRSRLIATRRTSFSLVRIRNALNPNTFMKFMVTWQLHQGKLHDTLSLFSQMTPEDEAAMHGPDIKILGRWHDLARGSGVAIVESDNATAISAYALDWNRFMEIDVSMVVDDDEARGIGANLPSEG